MPKSHFTTFQAAELLGVSADTVLRWIRSGKIRASRTFGGHYRIEAKVIDQLLRETGSNPPDTQKKLPYCWEHKKAKGGDVTTCERCFAYQSRTQYCFELAKLPSGQRPLNLYCDSECNNCGYFRHLQELLSKKS